MLISNFGHMTCKSTTTERQKDRNELNQSAAQTSPNMFLQPYYGLQRDNYVTLDEDTSESEEKVRSMHRCALDINKALERHNPKRTFDALTPLVNLSFCRFSYRHHYQSDEHLQSIRLFFHEELHTAMKEKGSYLTYEEIVAALDVLSYVLRVNEILEMEAPENILRLLISPEAYWEGVYNNRTMSETYSIALKELRESKRSAGRLPILTHAEIQKVIFTCNRAHQFSERQLKDPFQKAIYHPIPPTIRITEESMATAAHTVASKELHLTDFGRGRGTTNVDRLLININENSPLITYELLSAIVREYKLDVSLYQSEMAGVYHSFLLFAWRRWLACYTYMHGAASPTRQFPLETITKAVHRANRLFERMLQQGKAIARLNAALEVGDFKQIADALWKPQLKLSSILGITKVSTHVNRLDAAVPLEVLQTAYCEALRRVRKERLVRSTGYLRGLSSVATSVGNISPVAAYVESICPHEIGSGWIWNHVPAFDHAALRVQSEEEEILLSRFEVPYFYNVHSNQLVVWPLTSSHPNMETVWTNDLTQLRWPVGVCDPPTLDSGLLNREDCVAIITQLNAEYSRKHQVFTEMTSSVPQQDDLKAVKGWALHRSNKWDYPRECEKKRRLDEVPDVPHALRATAFNKTSSHLLNLCAVRIQSNWRRYLVQQAYRRRLAYLHSPHSVNAVRCLQRNWRRTLAMRKLRTSLSQHRRSAALIVKVQAHWRGHQVRQWFRAFRLVMQSCVDVGTNEYGYHLQKPNTSIQQIMGNAALMDFASDCIPFLSGHAAKKAFEMEMNCFLLGKSILTAIDKLVVINQELSSSSSLIKLLVQIRLSRQRKSVLKERPILPRLVGVDARTQVKKSETHNINGGRMLIYGPLCHLLYSQPDYVIALLHDLPTELLWLEDKKSPLPGYGSFKVSSYGLAFERLIFTLYRYGASSTDYVRIMHIFSRGIHQAVGDALTARSITNWYNGIRPWPFVLRMVVSFARMNLHRSGLQKKRKQSDDLELTLNKDKLQQLVTTLVNSIQSASPEDEIFRGPGSSLRSCSSMHTEPPLLTTQCLSQNNACQAEDAELHATTSEELSSIDSAILGLDRPQSFLAVDSFFRGIFIDPGPSLLPDCLKYAIHELYRALRHAFPLDPEKTHLKDRTRRVSSESPASKNAQKREIDGRVPCCGSLAANIYSPQIVLCN
ncbi:unnamed protein product [Dicrocoelium dendriticum]|nr:unnamed protein product [Dicrocoelium dendriticum]